MNAIIIEDEKRAADNLRRLISTTDPNIEVIAELQTIDGSVEWFRAHPMPDIVFLDIHLADGSSFEIFKEININCPIIFTTAYDEYALKAFGVNSVDYLLKPIREDDLRRALNKVKTLSRESDMSAENSELIKSLIETLRKGSVYKSSLLVAHKDKLIPVSVEEIAYIYTENKIVKTVTFGGSSHVLDQTLEDTLRHLDPRIFFRINRQYIVSRRSIKDASVWFAGRLALNLIISTPERLFVSRSNMKEFKQWITG
ncbi:MAG: LytTR family DNA-binding domain-containing protein [Bacteroidales bacterium]|jgi:two-component system LytT family response regulator|nr:LytTR family DNA-binding domain-containing protein [Bacteroidales bacterium]